MSTPARPPRFTAPAAPVKAKRNMPPAGALNVLNFKPNPFRATSMPNFSKFKVPGASSGGKTRRSKTRRARRSTRRH